MLISKKCSKCEIEKLAEFFYKNKRSASGLNSACKECSDDSTLAYRASNVEKVRAAKQARYARLDKEKERARKLAWSLANPDVAREHRTKHRLKVRATARGKLDHNISNSILRSVKSAGKYATTYEILGYSREELMSHLEALFSPGMTWENYGKGGWHVDHKIPLAAHNYQSSADIDFGRAWALSNLQPLWEFDNLSKGDRLFESFQPSLALAA